MVPTKAKYLFEVSWEVCNKVGGIYTVVKSKAAQITNYYKENYFLIGPYFTKQLNEFSEEIPKDFFKVPFNELKKEGIVCHCGKWLIEGQPNVILVDFESFKEKANEIKRELWEDYKIDSLRAAYDYTEPVVWSYAVGKLIEKLAGILKNKKVVAHFHEWLSGAALLYLKKKKANVGTVFTTHSTVLGRTLASSNVDLYGVWGKINADEEVYKYFIEPKHQIEKQAALNSDVFSTVSEITAMEAEHLLGKKADILLMNGLDIEKFPTFEEIVIKHRIQRERIREFLLYYFLPYYDFDIKETLFYFLAGRYEFRDKGIDIFIKALGMLNKRMKESGHKKTIIAFIWVPANIRNIKPELLESKTYYQDIKDALEDVTEDVNKNILYSVISNKKITKSSLFDKNFLLEMKNKINRFNKRGNPSLPTHDLYESNDAITKALKESNLNNNKEDPVKVVYYPIYLSGADGLLNLNYYEAMQGSHLGVFPSYYEPWGYTPLEAGALGVSSVTTDLAGFGRFFYKEPQKENPGIFVLKRFGKSEENVVKQLVKIMLDFSNLSRHDRIANKIQARKIASTADWKILIKNYIQAHNMAVERVK